jgi:formylglycine-generating enzyme required for sulfatase activity
MRRISALILVLLATSIQVLAGDYLRGDTNGDGVIDINDVTELVDYLMCGEWSDSQQVDTFSVAGVSFNMIRVDAGSFMMGAAADDDEAADRERPAHQVTLSGYSIGETEVTQELWQAVMGYNPSDFTDDPQRPVDYVSWDDCQLFISKLNEMTGMAFRLPTEPEWEFAARGGNRSKGYKYAGSDNVDDVAWYEINAYNVGMDDPDFGPHAVKTKTPNELGLYDMSGNVMEWCQDYYGLYSNEAQTDPVGPSSGYGRVTRGGSWGGAATSCRVSYRGAGTEPSSRGHYRGFRLAQTIHP